MSLYYDRKGKPIDLWEWSRLFQDRGYQQIELLEERRDDGTSVVISTIWLGIDHGLGGPPQIFETMIFISDDEQDKADAAVRDAVLDMIRRKDFTNAENLNDPKYHPYHQLQWRWHTEEEAREAHRLIVEAYRENKDPRDIIRAWEEQKRREGMN